ncbi:unnamed protein product [Linum trigynum]|uniref:Secreted protein n=1 Tax=Linum trigynum TaxID=586398 RepID=A0AAV2F536_9ROSI
MFREALSSLLLLCLVAGRWLVRAAAGAFVVSVRNQAKANWLLRPPYSVRSYVQEKGIREAHPIIRQEGKRPMKWLKRPGCASDRRGEARQRSLKRSWLLAFESPEISIDHQSKRCKQGSRKPWRFWLPQSSDFDEEEPESTPFAGCNAPVIEPQITQIR